MIARFVAVCLRRRALMLAIFVGLSIFGFYSLRELNIEAYPDIAPVTVQVITQYPGHAAEEVEQQITTPLERELNGLPGLHVMRSESTFALSLITLVFQDGTEYYFERQRVFDQINNVTLPPGVQAGLDDPTSPIGEIYRYTVQSKLRSPRELRDLNNWVVMPRIKQVPGVIDVAPFGGENYQFQVFVDPNKLAQYNLSLATVENAISANNINSGGSIIVRGEQGFVVRGLGAIQNVKDLGNIVIAQKDGAAVFVKDIGHAEMGVLERQGVLGIDDNDDAVEGITLLLLGANPSKVLDGVHKKVEELNTKVLPPDVKIVPYIDRTDLVHTTLRTVSRTLLEGMALVVVVLILFLGSLRAAILVALTIPFSLLFAFVLMYYTNIPANLLSLGAIDFGVIVNGSIVLMEVILRRYERNPDKALTEESALEAVLEVAQPMFFATIIIIMAYLPLFAFESVERRLFTPMAFTVGYSLIGGLFFALGAIPALTYVTYRKPGKTWQNPAFEWMRWKYDALLLRIVARPQIAIYSGLAAFVVAVVLALAVGREFLPYLDEGSMWVQIEMPPGISIAKATELAREYRMIIRSFPAVSHVVTQTGRNDDGTDPWTFSHIESCICLKPYNQWGGDKQALINQMSQKLNAEMPGMSFGFTQPMIDGIYDMIAGAHSELVIKIFGDDFNESRRIAQGVVNVLQNVRGAVDVAVDQEPPLPQLQIIVHRDAAARYGINVSDIDDLIETAIGGKAVSTVFIGDKSYDVNIRFIESARDNPDVISDLTLSSPSGARIPLSDVAEVKMGPGESTISHEMGRRYTTVRLDLRGRALSSFLTDAQNQIESKVKYDHEKFEIDWGGQFENEQRAQSRLEIIIPAALGLIFLILFAAFGKGRFAAIIMLTVPLALLGGFAALLLRGMTLNVSSAVGFIALFGVAVQNGVIMVSNLNRWRETESDLKEAVRRGARERLRPVLMTAAVATLGLLPAALSHSIGSDVQRPLATVVVGGLVTATALTLLVLPAAYYIVERRVLAKKTNTVMPTKPENP